MEYYGSPRWTGEIADCSMPMTMDTYSNCSYNCQYCFSQFQRALGGCKENYLHKKVKWVNPEKIKQMFLHPDSSQFGEYIKQRKVMQWGGLSDQFDENERMYGITLDLLKFFRKIEYPISFSTKSTWWTKDERYAKLFRNNPNWNVKVSIITLEEHKARIIEAGVDSPQERLEAIERIANWNAGGATLRLRPFVIGITTPSYLDLIREAHKRGATAVSTEFFCVEQRSTLLKQKMPKFNALCGFDLMQFYKKYSPQQGYLRLNRNVKRPFVQKMKTLCDELGMRFYVSDSHFKELSCNGSCCGLPENWNYSRGQFTQALLIAKEKGVVTYPEIKEDIEKLFSGFEWGSANGFNCGSSEKRAKFKDMTMADYMHYLWNNPQNGQSPYKLFEGVLIPEGKDENGDIIYAYNADRSIK